MKKKIKDLTLEQVKTICDKHLKKDKSGLYQCKICPYAKNYQCRLDYNYLNEYGNEEIEVEEDDF